jgi:hypothetical protein
VLRPIVTTSFRGEYFVIRGVWLYTGSVVTPGNSVPDWKDSGDSGGEEPDSSSVYVISKISIWVGG